MVESLGAQIHPHPPCCCPAATKLLLLYSESKKAAGARTLVPLSLADPQKLQWRTKEAHDRIQGPGGGRGFIGSPQPHPPPEPEVPPGLSPHPLSSPPLPYPHPEMPPYCLVGNLLPHSTLHCPTAMEA